MRILQVVAIEDSVEQLEILKHRLSEAKVEYSFTSYPTGEDALEALSQQADAGEKLPDVIFLDLHLPGKDGIDILKDFKSHDLLKDVPVIVYTSSVDKQDIVESYRAGGTFFMNKDWDEEILHDAISQIRAIKASRGFTN